MKKFRVRHLRVVLATAAIVALSASLLRAQIPNFHRVYKGSRLSPEDLQEALRRGELETARSLIAKRSKLVPQTIPKLIDAAIKAELASQALKASTLWNRAAQLASLYQDVSGSDFFAGYVARYRGFARYQKTMRLQAAAALKRAREHGGRGETELFRKELDRSASLWRQLRDRWGEAECLMNLCDDLRGEAVQGTVPSRDCARRAADLYLEAGDERGHAVALEWIAWRGGGEFAKTLQRAKAIFESLHDDWELVRTLLDLGWQLGFNREEYKRALETYDEAREVTIRMGDRRAEAAALMEKGVVCSRMEMYDASNELYLRSLAIQEEVGADPGPAVMLNLASNFYYLGLYSKSIRYAQRHKGIEPSHDYWLLASNYAALNDWEMAETSWASYIEFSRQKGHELGLVKALEELAKVRSLSGRVPEAEAALHEALEVLAPLPSNATTLAALHKVANRYKAVGNHGQARKLYSRVVEQAAALGNQPYVMEAHVGLGGLAMEAHDLDGARSHYEQAAELLPQLDDYHWRARAWLHIARFREAEGDPTSAMELYRSIVNDEELESFLLSHGQANKPTGPRWVRQGFEGAIAVLHRLSKKSATPTEQAAEAFQLAQRLQALNLRQLLAARGMDSQEPALAELVETEKTALRELSTAQRELTQETDPELRRVLLERVESLEDEHDLVRARLQIRQRPFADSRSLEALSLEHAQGALDSGTAALQYFLGEEHAFLWVLTRADAVMLELSPPKEIEEAVRFYLEALSSREPRDTYEEVSHELFSMLLEPALPQLSEITTLLIIPDGALHLLPFETLGQTASGFPLLGYSVGYLPATSLLLRADDGTRRRASNEPPGILLVADAKIERKQKPARPGQASIPEELTERGFYERGGFDFRPLTHARREVRRIARIFRGSAATLLLTGKKAAEDRIKALDLGRFSTVHFATHALSDETVPMRSAVVLTPDEGGKEDGFLQVREILNLNLDADLVVLSGCETGRGKLLKGEGVVGLSRAFLAAGGRSLVVSLWRVNDRSTALLMEAFYRNLKAGMGKADALRQAKLSLMKVKDGRYAHPYYWAPFVLIGDHRRSGFLTSGRTGPTRADAGGF